MNEAERSRNDLIDRATWRTAQGIIRGESLRELVGMAIHDGMAWRFNQPDVQAVIHMKPRKKAALKDGGG